MADGGFGMMSDGPAKEKPLRQDIRCQGESGPMGSGLLQMAAGKRSSKSKHACHTVWSGLALNCNPLQWAGKGAEEHVGLKEGLRNRASRAGDVLELPGLHLCTHLLPLSTWLSSEDSFSSHIWERDFQHPNSHSCSLASQANKEYLPSMVHLPTQERNY